MSPNYVWDSLEHCILIKPLMMLSSFCFEQLESALLEVDSGTEFQLTVWILAVCIVEQD